MSIHLEFISKSYGKQLALDQVSFEAKKGEIIGLLGPNGAGKSTLMKILTGFIQPDEGSAFLHGDPILEKSIESKMNIGYLPEQNPLYEDMYVREYLEFQSRIYGVNKNEIPSVIEKIGLSPEAHKKIGQLSKGYQQRVGLASAILHDPDVLILDEPTTGLDPNQLVDIRSLIQELGKEKTILLSTHILQEVTALCDRVLILNKGKLLLDRKIEEIDQDLESLFRELTT